VKYDAALDVSTSKSAVRVLNRQDGAVVLARDDGANAMPPRSSRHLSPVVGGGARGGWLVTVAASRTKRSA
jgi:hypothetical protein